MNLYSNNPIIKQHAIRLLTPTVGELARSATSVARDIAASSGLLSLLTWSAPPTTC